MPCQQSSNIDLRVNFLLICSLIKYEKLNAGWNLYVYLSLGYTGGPISLQQWVIPDSEQREVTHLAGAAGGTH